MSSKKIHLVCVLLVLLASSSDAQIDYRGAGCIGPCRNTMCCDWITLNPNGVGFARDFDCRAYMEQTTAEEREYICKQLREQDAICPEIAPFCVNCEKKQCQREANDLRSQYWATVKNLLRLKDPEWRRKVAAGGHSTLQREWEEAKAELERKWELLDDKCKTCSEIGAIDHYCLGDKASFCRRQAKRIREDYYRSNAYLDLIDELQKRGDNSPRSDLDRVREETNFQRAQTLENWALLKRACGDCGHIGEDVDKPWRPERTGDEKEIDPCDCSDMYNYTNCTRSSDVYNQFCFTCAEVEARCNSRCLGTDKHREWQKLNIKRECYKKMNVPGVPDPFGPTEGPFP